MQTGITHKPWLRISGLAALLIALLVGMSTLHARSLNDITSSGVLRIGVIPFDQDIIKDPRSGEYGGAFIDAAEYICENMQVRCEYVEVTWQSFVAALQAGRIDVSIASTYSTISRATAVAFSRPIYYLGYKGVTRAGHDRFEDVGELNDSSVRVAVCQGCGQMEWVQSVAPDANLRVVTTEEAAMLEVVTGQADIAIGAASAADNALASQSSLRAALGGHIYSMNQVAWATNYANVELKFFIDTAIGQLIASGALREFAEEHGAPWADAIAN
ncbi:polar amino acid transport system substrate-binding protein [Natronocella acetinitrilica]|uniref:Polar amino acid transport system substrate-binding protein n=1 Tax=Natronocella acetinitrilica TaxID=414046 RepID=A0AAE3G4N5_9GAMM|nr:transporter substrate-binding domain-containing protein [Natronocella acetinitrilica]MCP1675751.1 polar amino acid transport system substrate-binding protein [Natronocella acetinitrilica]